MLVRRVMVRQTWRRDVSGCDNGAIRQRGMYFESIWYSKDTCSKCSLPEQSWNAQYGGALRAGILSVMLRRRGTGEIVY